MPLDLRREFGAYSVTDKQLTRCQTATGFFFARLPGFERETDTPERPAIFRPETHRTRQQANREYDDRRGSAHARGYNRAWSKASKGYLAKHPLCLGCEAIGRIVPAAMVDHVIPHRGDRALFWDSGNWQPSCAWHHNRIKQRLEVAYDAGRATAADLRLDSAAARLLTSAGELPSDGWSKEVRERRMPTSLQPSRIPLVIVCGPAGSGKSTYVATHRGPRDVVIDLDAIMSEISGKPEHHTSSEWLERALVERNCRLSLLATDSRHAAAWFIISAPDPIERDLWAQRLGGRLVVLDTPLDECIRRINADPSRAGHRPRMIAAATAWWSAQPVKPKATADRPI